jgi:ferredoxin
MIELTIDGIKVTVAPGTTVMDAAQQLGIVIPSMCHNGDLPHFASCMVCVVKNGAGHLIPSCSVAVTPGMEITTLDDEIREARKTALDLLLSDHTGDCQAPCQVSCPAHMNIPEMNRLLAAGKFDEAFEVVMRDIPLPSILGRICPAPCESVCRRETIDQAVSICLLKRFVGDKRLMTNSTSSGLQVAGSRLQVAVIGSGPYGLSAAWFLQQFGYQCTIFDWNVLPGGALRYSIPQDVLPVEILDQEIDRIKSSGVIFKMKTDIGPEELEELRRTFDAVVEPHKKTTRMAVRALSFGKIEAFRVHQQLTGQPVIGEYRRFNSRFGKLMPEEFPEYLKESSPIDNPDPKRGILGGFTDDEVMAEAARCLHCECLKPDDCKLRNCSDEYKADQKRFQGPSRKPVTRIIRHDAVVFEPQKCIKCGICVRITEIHREELGLTFIGRGFDVTVGVPFNESIQEGLTHTALLAADACPTGALARKEKGERKKEEG